MQSFNHSEAPHTYTISQFGCVGFKTVHLKVSIGSALIIEKKCCFRFRKQIFRNDLCVCYSVKFFPCLPAWRANIIKGLLPYLIEILQRVNHWARYYMQKFQTQFNSRILHTGLLQIYLPETPNKITICLQKSVPLLIKGHWTILSAD